MEFHRDEVKVSRLNLDFDPVNNGQLSHHLFEFQRQAISKLKKELIAHATPCFLLDEIPPR